MKLSSGERLLLVMLADIQQKLGIDGEIDANLVKSAIVRGHAWALEGEYSWLKNDNEDDPAIVEETDEILTMWRIIDNSVSKLTPDEMKSLEKACYPHSIRFSGFDGNNDDHHGIARFMVNELEFYTERKEGPMNSHSRTELPLYRAMLQRLNAIEDKYVKPLTSDQLVKVIKG